MNNYFSIALFLFCLNACGKFSNINEDIQTMTTTETAAAASESMVELKEPSPPDLKREETTIPTQIRKTADINFQVKEVEESHRRIEKELGKFKAYFGNDSRSQSNRTIRYDEVIRVPNSLFDSLVSAILNESIYTNNKSIVAQDVTDQFVDISTRLKNKKELEARYLAILKMTSKVTDLLEIEKSLHAIREEIEVQEGQLKLLTNQVNYSTINVSFYQNLDYTPEPTLSFFSKVKESFVAGWRVSVELFIGLVSCWPYFILLPFLFFVYKKWKGRKGK